MDTKPFSLQSPEAIAKEYDGNKQKIAHAVQLGLVDPTAGTLAGMFIDRMRSAQTQEQVPQQTVSQQVFTPPQMPQGMPQGLGALAPQGVPAMPPQGAPAPAMPPQGMASGGLVSFDTGGLASLSVPDTMFDEPSNGGFNDGGYAGGGLVSFAKAGEVTQEDDEQVYPDTGEIAVMAPPPAVPDSRYGFYNTIARNLQDIKANTPQEDKYGKKATEYYENAMSPEAIAKQKKQDVWSSLAQLGFGMAASKSPTFLGALGEAGSAAAPGMEKRLAASKAAQENAIKALADREDISNKQAREAHALATDMTKAYGGFMDADQQRKLQERMNKADNETRILAANIAGEWGVRQAATSGQYSVNAASIGENRLIQQARMDAGHAVDNILSAGGNPQYVAAAKAGNTALMNQIRTQMIDDMAAGTSGFRGKPDTSMPANTVNLGTIQ